MAARFPAVTKVELIEDINEMVDDCLSMLTEIALKKLSMTELMRMKDELKRALDRGDL